MKRAYLILLSCWLLVGCKSNHKPVESDLPDIRKKGIITAVTISSSTSYFLYRDQPMGYEYEMIKEFADAQGLELSLVIAENIPRLTEILLNGEADIVAYPITYDRQKTDELTYCGIEQESHQVLVQRANREDTLITDVTGLIGKEVYVKSNTSYFDRLEHLNQELGGGIIIRDAEQDTLSTEDLIEKVSQGQIKYTVSDDKTARLNKTYYWNIDINLEVSFNQRSSWVVRKGSPQLADAINEWAASSDAKRSYQARTKRYFEISKKPWEAFMPEVKVGQISPYDGLFKRYAQKLGWDWQLLASISYQESHFDPFVVSWAGAQGIMGIMPATARGFGVSPDDLYDPEVSIDTGVKCFLAFRKGFADIEDPLERTKMTLASYNAGIGHVYDAQRLAEKYGKDPHVWDNNVADFIRLKSDPQYYNDPVCKFGYFRGMETFNYVNEVIRRYNYYKSKTV